MHCLSPGESLFCPFYPSYWGREDGRGPEQQGWGAGLAPAAQPCPIQRDGTAACQARAGPRRYLWHVSNFRGRAERSFSCCVHFCSVWPPSQQSNTNNVQVVPSPEPPRGLCSCSCLLSSFPPRLPDQHSRVLPKWCARNAVQQTRGGLRSEQPIPSAPRTSRPDPPSFSWRKAQEALPG